MPTQYGTAKVVAVTGKVISHWSFRLRDWPKHRNMIQRYVHYTVPGTHLDGLLAQETGDQARQEEEVAVDGSAEDQPEAMLLLAMRPSTAALPNWTGSGASRAPWGPN